MTAFLRKLAKPAPVALNNVFNGTPKSSYGKKFRVPIGVRELFLLDSRITYTSHHQLWLIWMRSKKNQDLIALNPDKWIKFELQDRASVSHSGFRLILLLGWGLMLLHVF